MLSTRVLDCSRWMQHLHLPSHRPQASGQVHSASMPTDLEAGAVHTLRRVPQRRRLEHVQVSVERCEERGPLHQPQMLDTPAEAQGGRRVLPRRAVLRRGWLQYLRLPFERPQARGDLHQTAVPGDEQFAGS